MKYVHVPVYQKLVGKNQARFKSLCFFSLLQLRFAKDPMLALKAADILCHHLVPLCGPEASRASRSICTRREKTNYNLVALSSLFITVCMVALVRTFFLYLFHLVNFKFRLQRGLRDAAECSNAVWINWWHQCE